MDPDLQKEVDDIVSTEYSKFKREQWLDKRVEQLEKRITFLEQVLMKYGGPRK